MQSLSIERSGPSQPVSILGAGQAGGSIVGEGSYSDESGSGPPVPVAVKMATAMRLQRPGVDTATEFKKEVRLLWRLSHANIVTCLGAVTHYSDGELCLWIVMEKLEQNLEDAILSKRIRLGREDPELFASIITGLVSALAYLHTSVNGVPVIHGNLQPSNVLLDKHKVPKLAGFGAASQVAGPDGSSGPVMRPSAASHWVAPEDVYTRASDMYVLGLLGNFVWAAELPASRASPAESTSHLAGYALHLLRGCRNRSRPIACSPPINPRRKPKTPPTFSPLNLAPQQGSEVPAGGSNSQIRALKLQARAMHTGAPGRDADFGPGTSSAVLHRSP